MTRPLLAALLALAALPAAAEEARWDFRPGNAWTYEAETVVEWSAAHGDAAAAQRGEKARHVETVELRFEVLEVGDGGAARIRGTVRRVRVQVTAAAGVAEWDSAKERTTRFLGFKRYEALAAVVFTATVAADGRVLEALNAGTPDRATTPAGAKEHEEIAAFQLHHPTPPRAWLELIFRSTPPPRKDTRRVVRFLEEESVSVSVSRSERVAGRSCVRCEFETPDRKAATDPKDVEAAEFSDPNAIAWGALRAAPKRGEFHFARADGSLVRLLADANASFGWGGKSVSARMTWRIEAK